MNSKMIDTTNGNVFISKDFEVNSSTKRVDLENYFGKDILEVDIISEKYCNASVRDLEVFGYYFILSFYFENEKLTHINFYPRLEAKNNSSWDNYDQKAEMNLMTSWMAIQAGDSSKFVWDLNVAGRQYSFSYKWGSMGTYYDFKNGTFVCVLTYKQ